MDLIEKWDAIEALKAIKQGLWEIDIPHPGNCPEYVEHHKQIKDMMEITDGWIKRLTDMPSPPWIPCSERLPENEYVLISKKPTKLSGIKWCVTIATRTADPRSREIKWRDIGFGTIQEEDVLAWMPLPEPFRGGEQGGSD